MLHQVQRTDGPWSPGGNVLTPSGLWECLPPGHNIIEGRRHCGAFPGQMHVRTRVQSEALRGQDHSVLERLAPGGWRYGSLRQLLQNVSIFNKLHGICFFCFVLFFLQLTTGCDPLFCQSSCSIISFLYLYKGGHASGVTLEDVLIFATGLRRIPAKFFFASARAAIFTFRRRSGPFSEGKYLFVGATPTCGPELRWQSLA